MTAKKLPASQGKNKEPKKDYEVGYKKPPVHSRWKPGQSGNPKGPPRRSDELREMNLRIFSETGAVQDEKGKKVGEISRIESLMRRWINSEDYQKQLAAIQYTYGKVPDEIKHSFNMDEFMQRYINKFTDGQLKRIQAGEHPLDILMESLDDKR